MTSPPFTTIFVLMYGEYPRMHKRMLQALASGTEGLDVEVRIWLNQLGKESLALVEANRQPEWVTYFSEDNVPKYTAMRLMFNDPEKPIESPWITWFDDDTWIVDKTWFTTAKRHIDNDPKLAYLGEVWFVHHLPGQWDFIKVSDWFNDKPPQKIQQKPGIRFCTGGYVWLRTDWVRKLDIPDKRLVHNGGDTLTGEAFRQWDIHPKHCNRGIKVNDGKRRGRSDRPAGSNDDVRR